MCRVIRKLKLAEGPGARRAQSGPRIGVRSWNTPCCAEIHFRITFQFGGRKSSAPWVHPIEIDIIAFEPRQMSRRWHA